MGFTHCTETSGFLNLDWIFAVISQIAKERTKPVERALLSLKDLYCAGIRRVLVYEQEKKHLQVGSNCKSSPGGGSRQFGADS
jgi:hypothetical protein